MTENLYNRQTIPGTGSFRPGTSPPRPGEPGIDIRPAEVQEAIFRAQEALLSRHDTTEKCWCAELRADTTLESDMIMLYNFLGRRKSPKIGRWAKFIISQQLPDGGWPIYRHGPTDLSATVKAYWALKFAGYDAHEPIMAKARNKIFQLGGIHKVNTYSKLYMALFGQYDWRGVPAVPPELMVFPKWFYFNLYEMSSWTRAIVVPLAIVWAKKPMQECPPHAGLGELFPDERRHVPLRQVMPEEGLFSWQDFFLLFEAALKMLEGKGPHFIRRISLSLAENWMLERLKNSDGLGAIFPPIVNAVIAMKALGYPDDDPRLLSQIRELERYEIDRGDSLEMQPSLSPVWDTAISIIALAESGLDRGHEALAGAAEWLLSKEIRMPGDWKVKNPRGPIGGWAFEYRNDFYPDIDDTAMVLLALRHIRLPDSRILAVERAFKRGLQWLMTMQSDNGGWGAFDRNNNKLILTKIPFADHNAMIDPPTADVTARVLELLGYLGYGLNHPQIRAAVDFLKAEQEEDGSWYGRWGVNYIYGTWQAVRGLRAVGEPKSEPYLRKAARWIISIQNEDGGWGETCETYSRPELKGEASSSPTQTAWAVMALLSMNMARHPATQAGIRYLLAAQRKDGAWYDDRFTGTGFPRVFYLDYTLYPLYFPLLALGMYQQATYSFTRRQS